MDDVIEADGVHKGYGSGASRTPILRGIDLRVRRGEAVFLVGPSGSGKTTLLSVLGCILGADRGRVRLLGQDVSDLSPEGRTAVRRRWLGFIFQDFLLLPTLSALDNLRVVLGVRGMAPAAAAARSGQLLEAVGLGPRARLRPAQLSTGERQRVAVARALADEPPIVLADEPTASLDADNGRAVMDLLMGLVRARGSTLVMVTHDTRVFPFADRILRLEDGRVSDSGVSAAGSAAGREAAP